MNEPNSTLSTEVASEPEEQAPQDAERKPSRRSQGNAALVLSLIAICLSVGFAATAFFIWNQLQQVTGQQAGIGSRVDERMQPVRESIELVAQTVRQLDEKSERGFRAAEQRSDRAEQEQQSLDHRVSVLGALMGRSEQGWSLAEVEYLLGIANQRLQLQRDAKTAMVALQSADARLRELADPHYLNVREQIAKDIEALGLVPEVDVDGISLVLSAWSERIDELPVAGTRYQPPENSVSTDFGALKTVDDWKQLPRLVWQSLQQLFQLREHDTPVKPMLAPEREYFLRENLRLQLAAAKLALLRNDSEQYQAAIGTSREWLANYFSGENDSIIKLQAKLVELLQIDIRPVLPDVSRSLRLLRQQMKLSEPQVPARARSAPAEISTTEQQPAETADGEGEMP